MSMANPRAVLRGRATKARAVGSFLPKLTGKAFEKYGFSTVSLLTDWPVIVGDDLARITRPERLSWPRNADAYVESAPSGRDRTGAALTLRVDAARALDVQYRSSEIIERINAYFGYRAVGAMRLLQAPLPKARQSVAATGATTTRQPSPSTAGTSRPTAPDTPLEAALARLGHSVQVDTMRRRNARFPA